MAKNEKTQKTGRIAATIAELKQVSWPAFPKVLRKLGSVLIITGMFLLVFMGMDALLKWMYNALIMGVVGTWNEAGGYFTMAATDTNPLAVTMYVGELIAAAIVAAALVTGGIVAVIIMKSRKKEDF